MDRGRENPRGVHAMRLLETSRDLTLEGLMDIAYDPQLPGFEDLIPAVLRAVDEGAASAAQRARLEGPAEVLRSWDLRWGIDSVATTLAVFLGDELVEAHRDAARDAELDVFDFISTGLSPRQLVAGLEAAVARLEADFGTWRTPWGEVNRLQRLTGALEPTFDDDAPSTPVGFTSSRWGSLAAFAALRRPELKRLYGVGGNSFVAVVEFGDRVRARAVTVGGVSGDPSSPHFDDQLERYAAGDLREVYFYPDELEDHVERVYHPGE
jgi:acyl-homoserine-lactone acylase